MTRVLPVLDNRFALQPEFQPVVSGILHQLKAGLAAHLHSVYLAGSIARGDGHPGQSDLNLTLVLHRPLTAAQLSTLDVIERRTAHLYGSVIRGLDIQWVTLDDVLGLDGIFRWGFWLKHGCRCLSGDDLSSRFGQFEASWDIAKMQNGDLREQLENYRRRIMATRMVAQYLDDCRSVAKKMVWSCFSLVFHRERRLALSVEQAAEMFLGYYPEKKTEIERLFVLISGTQVPKKATLFMITDFGGWIVAEFDKIDRKIG